MKRKIWRAFCSYYAQHPFEKDDEVIVFLKLPIVKKHGKRCRC